MLSEIATTAATTGAAPASPQPRLVRAAHEFEAQMMKELLKPMTAGNGLTAEDDDSASGSCGALGEFASEALGRALSEQGGLGIAASIVRDLSHTGTKPVIAGVTGNSHRDTVIRSLE